MIIVVEDDKFTLDCFVDILSRDTEVVGFADPELFCEYCEDHKDKVSCAEAIILDYWFDFYNIGHKELVLYIRENLNFKGKILLFTHENEISDQTVKNIDGFLPNKKILCYKAIKTQFLLS